MLVQSETAIKRLLALFLLALPLAAQKDFLPMAVWYGGGKARAPMLEAGARSKKELWRKDVQQIKALGFNAIRAWIDWATGEPAPGEYRFETLDVLTELAEEEGLRVFVQVYMDSAPEWVGRQHPDSLFVSSNGQAIQPESSPGYCRDHPAVRSADNAFYKALSARMSKSKAFAGFDLWSEPHVINWANPTYIGNPEFCFCKNTLARFRAWLKQRYGTLDALNQAWYRRFQSWDEVEPNRLSTILSYSDYIDWKAFIVDKLGEDLGERRAAVKSAGEQVLATSHAAGVGLFASPHYWEGQSDDWRMAKEVDYYGTSFYPKHSAFVDRDPQWRAALLDFTRSFGYAQGRDGFYIGELQSGFGTIAVNVSPTVTPEDLRMWTWSAIARGARGVCYYAWYPMSTGYESGGFGMIRLDGTVTERAKTAGGIAARVNANMPTLLKAKPPKAEVAIIYNPLAHFVGGRQRQAAYGGPQGEVAGIERDSLLGAYKAWFGTNVPLDFVHLEHVTTEQLRQYRLVYLPYPLMLPERSAQVLREYVELGGALVSEARPGWNNERGRASERIPGMGLDEVFGVVESAIETAPGGRTEIQWQASAGGQITLPAFTTLPARWFKETLEPKRDTTLVRARFADGGVAATESRFGKGKAMLVGSYVAAAYHTRPTEETKAWFDGLLTWAGVRRRVAATAGDAEIRWLENGANSVVFVFNHATEEREVKFQMEGAVAAFDMETGKSVTLPFVERIPAQGVRVLSVRTSNGSRSNGGNTGGAN